MRSNLHVPSALNSEPRVTLVPNAGSVVGDSNQIRLALNDRGNTKI